MSELEVEIEISRLWHIILELKDMQDRFSALGIPASNIIPDDPSVNDTDEYDYGSADDYLGYALEHLEHDALKHLANITKRRRMTHDRT